MKRVIVLGGAGLFGRTVVEQFSRVGIKAIVAGRRSSNEIQVDADDAVSVRGALKPGDLVIDTAGPYQRRSMALIEAAIDVGFDAIDINDNLRYAEQVVALESKIAAAGIRVLSSASSVSVLSAAVIERSGITDPVRVGAFLAPASRHTANRGTALSLIESVGRPVRVFRKGRLQKLLGWSEPRQFLMPALLGPIRGRLFESADSLYLPRAWPLLQDVAMYVDTNTPGVNTLLRLAAHAPPIRRCLELGVNFGTRISKLFGSEVGGIGYEIEDAAGKIVRLAVLSAKNSFVVAVAPAVLAAQLIIEERFKRSGLIPPQQQVESPALFGYLQSLGIEIVSIP